MSESFTDALARERHERIPRMALRPHHEFPDEMDDIVVKDVQMFRAEQMSDSHWWMCCYFANGESVTFGVGRATKPARVYVTVTETPGEWIDIDAGRVSSENGEPA